MPDSVVERAPSRAVGIAATRQVEPFQMPATGAPDLVTPTATQLERAAQVEIESNAKIPVPAGEPAAPVFLVGFPRSGTTLLDQILDRHPGIVFRDGPAGRRAAVVGGPDVWEIIGAVHSAPERGDRRVEPVALVRVRVEGAGDAELNVSDELDVSISGYGRVRYHGAPRIRQSIAGAGSVQRLDD